MNKIILDRLGRTVKDLRISLIDRCNFRCTYCMPKEIFDNKYNFLTRSQLLSFAEIVQISESFLSLGVEKLRLTGGEPLLRKNICSLVRELKKLKTINKVSPEVTLTTNGLLLGDMAKSLKRAGLDRVTVSLDSINQEIFQKMIDKEFNPEIILANIDKSVNAGLQVKVNMVVKKGVNDSQIIPMADYFKRKKIHLRFIEFMDVGNSNNWDMNFVVPTSSILKLLDKKFGISFVGKNAKSEVADTWLYKTGESFGTISSVTKPFCGACSRARISSDGKLYTCLFSSKGYELKEILNEPLTYEEKVTQLKKYFAQVWTERVNKYSAERSTNNKRPVEKKIEMSYIGG